jgi:hypothetical protein
VTAVDVTTPMGCCFMPGICRDRDPCGAAGFACTLLTGISGTVGGEFKAAIEEAQAVQARIVFGDQPVEVTSSRMASRVGFRVSCLTKC